MPTEMPAASVGRIPPVPCHASRQRPRTDRANHFPANSAPIRMRRQSDAASCALPCAPAAVPVRRDGRTCAAKGRARVAASEFAPMSGSDRRAIASKLIASSRKLSRKVMRRATIPIRNRDVVPFGRRWAFGSRSSNLHAYRSEPPNRRGVRTPARAIASQTQRKDASCIAPQRTSPSCNHKWRETTSAQLGRTIS